MFLQYIHILCYLELGEVILNTSIISLNHMISNQAMYSLWSGVILHF